VHENVGYERELTRLREQARRAANTVSFIQQEDNANNTQRTSLISSNFNTSDARMGSGMSMSSMHTKNNSAALITSQNQTKLLSKMSIKPSGLMNQQQLSHGALSGWRSNS
jgi:hypothetical protein